MENNIKIFKRIYTDITKNTSIMKHLNEFSLNEAASSEVTSLINTMMDAIDEWYPFVSDIIKRKRGLKSDFIKSGIIDSATFFIKNDGDVIDDMDRKTFRQNKDIVLKQLVKKFL